MKSPSLTRRDIERNLPEQFVTRGEEYVREGRVERVRAGSGPGRFEAFVAGTEGEPYKVEVQVFPGNGGARIYGKCTCPVGVNCKHVAATLLTVLDKPPPRIATDPTVNLIAPLQRSMERAPRAREAGNGELSQPWVTWLNEAAEVFAPPADKARAKHPAPQRLLYVLDLTAPYQRAGVRVKLMTARLRKDGTYGAPAAWHNARNAINSPPSFVGPDDQRILKMLLIEGNAAFDSEVVIRGGGAERLLPALLATGRCHLGSADAPPLAPGEPLPARVRWVHDEDGSQRIVWECELPLAAVLPLSPPWYVDEALERCGLLEAQWAPEIAWMLSTMPDVPAEEVGVVRAALENRFPGLGIPMPDVLREEDVRGIVPRPCLRLVTLQAVGRGYRAINEFLSLACLRFDYDGVRVGAHDPGIVRQFQRGILRRIRRDGAAEKDFHVELRRMGLVPAADLGHALPEEFDADYVFPHSDDWVPFVCERVPELRDDGWVIEFDESFAYQPVEIEEWHAEVSESGRDWFDLSLGVDVEGRRMDLLPILVTMLRERPDLFDKTRDADAPEHLAIRLQDGRLLPVPVARVRPIMAILDELLDAAPSGKVRLQRLDAARLNSLEQASELRWRGGEALRSFGQRLSHFDGVVPVSPPQGLKAELRPYQADGLAWLQFLREYEVAGVLADDMGLGKTVQALAHVLVEKEAGRLDRPALIVAPTSVVPNWRAEAARFAPGLRVHVSHGLKRKEVLDRLGQYDLVITTYPLLPRDKAVLMEQEFHLVILDEAQQIKNAQTQAAAVVRSLQARHRLCLTGTPLENHLGELWSLFNFLMPGFLGDATSFRRNYRTPIEKHDDLQRRAGLERRLRPFLLRRTKEQVASELPPKTEIVRPVELGSRQRELYETVRAAMDERVRREIASRGLAQSQIVLLDALLKLRQVCCDPRLVKLDAARKIEESAKLDLLLEMLDELLAEGRRVLLFSQFTEMLGLIEAELRARGIEHVKLTGDTQDRARPVQLFQEGKVPLFLISLKAGGTGLNLTAADTVIHYDPWWNPAVERQATDRAHRIGQENPVFVYKLIVAGSVEEKIARMQADKAALAAAILGEPGASSKPLTQDDIAALFEPLGKD
ncbi:MAG: DEAD/DEAH box helicase [Betaproteobacteria bacterium]|nr:DEAD/DEAH box helicase [Betaproteobacteria bacterium]